MSLGQQFAALFASREARRRLASLGHRIVLPTFALTTTSLRHIGKWYDRLQDIADGIVRTHGNYVSDPTSIGLVDDTQHPAVLTPAGAAFLATRGVEQDPAHDEYELIRILYFANFSHSAHTADFLQKKRDHLLAVLGQLTPSASTEVLLSRPSLLVIAEYIVTFPGALPAFVQLPATVLRALAGMGEDGFQRLCDGPGFPTGLNRLCRKIASQYTRAEDRRLHYAVAMTLHMARQTLRPGRDVQLVIPAPFVNLLSAADLYEYHGRYTSDLSIWFDGVTFRVALLPGSIPAGAAPAVSPPKQVTMRPQQGVPSGVGHAAATHVSRTRRRAARQERIAVMFDALMSERAEDFAEEHLLRPHFGTSLVRAGHRDGEVLALADGAVPGADFYVVDHAGQPVEFIEIKCIQGFPPTKVLVTRAEYLRAQRCDQQGIPYRLLLINLVSRESFEVPDFALQMAQLDLDGVVQFVVTVG